MIKRILTVSDKCPDIGFASKLVNGTWEDFIIRTVDGKEMTPNAKVRFLSGVSQIPRNLISVWAYHVNFTNTPKMHKSNETLNGGITTYVYSTDK